MKYPGKIYLPESNKTCQENVFIDYKEVDIYNIKFLDILKGRSSTSNILSNIRNLNTNRNSRIFIYITSHGGDRFIKFRGKYVILSEDLNRALIEMYDKGRYKEILFVLDTCEAFTLYDNVNTELAPNIYFIASSIYDEKASSINYSKDQMTPLADRFSYLMYIFLEQIQANANFNIEISKIFEKIQADPQMKTKVASNNNIKRKVLFKDYFGNHSFYKNTYYNKHSSKFQIEDKSNNLFPFNPQLTSLLQSANRHFIKMISNYHSETYMNKKFMVEELTINNNEFIVKEVNLLKLIVDHIFNLIFVILFATITYISFK